MPAVGEGAHVIILGRQVVDAVVLRKDGVVFAFRHLVVDQPGLKDPKRMTRPPQDFRGYDLERVLVARDSGTQTDKNIPQLHRTLKVERWVYRENTIESIPATHWSVRRLGELQQAANESLIELASTLVEDGASANPAHVLIDLGAATAPALTEGADSGERRHSTDCKITSVHGQAPGE
jgi:hypothetical protein